MASYDLDEQEKIAELKAFWGKFGNSITWLLTLIFAALAAWYGWQWYERSQALQAGVIYEQLEQAIKEKNLSAIKDSAGKLLESYGSTAYGQMAGLQAAKSLLEGNDAKSAKAQLQWVAAHAKDESYRIIARVRLAGILLDEGALEEALKLLNPSPLPVLEPLVLDRKADVLVAQNKLEEAKSVYLQAYNKLNERDAMRNLIRAKLESIGGTVPEPSLNKVS
ncbi:MAG: tetratricopeptide repeat protein [Burkholderiaceae bacterium]|nr:tetratricopeptide repeat protein [Burkholderiaceae bacterium]